MDKVDKAFWISLMISLVVSIAMLTAWAMPFGYEEIVEIWLPNNYNVVNRVDNSWVTIPRYDREKEVKMEFDNLMTDYKEKFSNESFYIYILSNSTVCYSWTYHGVAMMSQTTCGNTNREYDVAVENVLMPRDNQIKILYTTSPVIILLYVLAVCGSLLLAIFVSWFVEKTQ